MMGGRLNVGWVYLPVIPVVNHIGVAVLVGVHDHVAEANPEDKVEQEHVKVRAAAILVEDDVAPGLGLRAWGCGQYWDWQGGVGQDLHFLHLLGFAAAATGKAAVREAAAACILAGRLLHLVGVLVFFLSVGFHLHIGRFGLILAHVASNCSQDFRTGPSLGKG
jgi:hypothetical protein